MNIEPIAYFESPIRSKFGLPRQSGIAESLKGRIVFTKEFNDLNAFRGLEGFSHLWLIWGFSQNKDKWQMTVRPPRLGGNVHVGVFATRSPFRPNGLGLSSVLIEKIDFETCNTPVISVSGADLMDGTPIYDIKPYISYTDSHPQAESGFTDSTEWRKLDVDFPGHLAKKLKADDVETLKELLALDPRPAYHNEPERVYGLEYENFDIRFKVEKENLTVVDIINNIK